MTGSQFRKLALQLPEAVESAHCGHPDFRVAKKVFASLTADEKTAAVKLTLDQQQELINSFPGSFTPCAGAWGERGYTYIDLKSAKVATVKNTLLLAWRNTAPRKLLA